MKDIILKIDHMYKLFECKCEICNNRFKECVFVDIYYDGEITDYYYTVCTDCQKKEDIIKLKYSLEML